MIPVGISFYTFQKVAFVPDTLHYRKPLPRFLDYMNFAGFFPQIVARPTEWHLSAEGRARRTAEFGDAIQAWQLWTAQELN